MLLGTKGSITSAALYELVTPPRFAGRIVPDSEDWTSLQLASDLAVAAIEGRLLCSYTMIPHEVAAVSKSDPAFNRMQARYAKQRAMGFIKGSSDWVFTWNRGGGWIELKSDTGSLSPTQRSFRNWCWSNGSNWALCRSSAEALQQLREWGVLL